MDVLLIFCPPGPVSIKLALALREQTSDEFFLEVGFEEDWRGFVGCELYKVCSLLCQGIYPVGEV
jgi:hypothetical protein